ncbi:MAG: TIGR03790 family protein [Armatimonadetes bacterium]|nr:TIGR03790 family protein [Armatimonadota bacterium]
MNSPRFRPMWMALLASLMFALIGCEKDNGELVKVALDPRPAVAASSNQAALKDEQRVLLVINDASAESREVGSYYVQKRGIPTENIVRINVSTTENMPLSEYQKGIEEPVKQAIRYAKNRIDFIVLTIGTPIRLDNDNGFSVDGHLAMMDQPEIKPIGNLNQEEIMRCASPYFGSTEPIDSSKKRMYLVTRLIGYTVADCKRLVDNSIAAEPRKGQFFFDLAGNRRDGSYGALQALMRRSHENLTSIGMVSTLEETEEFIAPGLPVMGYVTWGSNDGKFDASRYKKVKFFPGAICETFVSTSGRTFKPTEGGQSLIADLIANGVTGVKGYVSEPYTFALARPDLMFDRYVKGFTLAESFYIASPVVKWKDIVVGDPICRPYKPIKR